VTNSIQILDRRTKWTKKERRLVVVDRLVARLGEMIEAPASPFIDPGLKGVQRLTDESLARVSDVPEVRTWPDVMALPFIITEPRGLELRPFCDPAPASLAGKYTARQSKMTCEATVQPPHVFELAGGDPTGPLHPRFQGLAVHDTVGQWVHAPGASSRYGGVCEPTLKISVVCQATSSSETPS